MLAPLLALALAQAETPDLLFAQARDAMARKDYEHACPLFEKSMSAEPALGTLLNLAGCYQQLGKTASAWLRYNEAATWARRTKESARETFALKEAVALTGVLSRLAIQASAYPAQTVLIIDGAAPTPLGADISLPLDPGRHTLRVEAPGFELQERQLELDARVSTTWGLKFVAMKSTAELVPAPAAAVTVTPPTATSTVGRRHPTGIPIILTCAGFALAATGGAGLGYIYYRHDAYLRQQPGGPDAANPTVTRSEWSTLGSVYPLGWVGLGVGAALLVAGLWGLLGNWSPF